MARIFFNIDEIFEMAEQIEKNGARFYRRAAEGAVKPEAREVLAEFALWEDKHQEIFSRMRSEYSRTAKDGGVFGAEEEEVPYLRAWADGHVFDVRSDPAKRLSGRETMEDILKIAIGLEKDSIVFYLGFKDALPNKSDREKIEEILKEEMKHVAVLSTQLSALKSDLT